MRNIVIRPDFPPYVCLLIINLAVNQKYQQIPSQNGIFSGHISGHMPSLNQAIVSPSNLVFSLLGI